jgi:hypothetical protein
LPQQRGFQTGRFGAWGSIERSRLQTQPGPLYWVPFHARYSDLNAALASSSDVVEALCMTEAMVAAGYTPKSALTTEGK